MSYMSNLAIELLKAPSMEPQPFCAYCGKAPGGPTKVHIVEGKRVEYPDLIDAHHVAGRPGPVVYLCHECHDHHHMVSALQFAYVDNTWYAGARGQHLRPLIIAAEWDL